MKFERVDEFTDLEEGDLFTHSNVNPTGLILCKLDKGHFYIHSGQMFEDYDTDLKIYKVGHIDFTEFSKAVEKAL